MNIEQAIQSIIEQEFSPVHFALINESYKHKGHAGDDGSGQTHFKLMVVSGAFDGLSRVDRQRLVNVALKDLFSSGLHALSVSLKAPSEI
jgi:BolA protein